MNKAVFLVVCCLLLGSVAGAQAGKTSNRATPPATTPPATTNPRTGGIAPAQTGNVSTQRTPHISATSKTTGDFNLKPSNRFSIEIDGVSMAGVRSLTDLNALRQQARSGNSTSSDVAQYRDGEDGVNRTRPGNHKPGTLVLTKDWSNTLEWYNWRKAVLDGKTDRRSISIIIHDDAGTEVGRMNFYNCWPSKHTMPEMKSKGSGHASETIELTYDSVEWKGK